MIIWLGRGVLVLLAIIADVLLSGVIGAKLGFKDATIQIYAFEFVLAIVLFLPIWFLGRKWNSDVPVLVDKATGQEIEMKNVHTMFFIPMQYWAIIWPVALLAIFVLTPADRHTSPTAPQAGAVRSG